ncbi:Nif11-like leader peptide family natural product precursor [Ramlibacter terrae]|uniref:Nif11-like leader peptide family natural product n=1 Tax=Ramlibacter terrae TaxID=2732511 RepID=A0ABX6P4V5_9BURK|nr:Nif11-like leader peptide family natural product precursor [Ramlibacter terrae]
MSLEAIHAFRSALASDPALQKLCGHASATGDAQSVVDAAAARGFTFSVSELEEVLADGELSDSELELVAGGGAPASQGGVPMDKDAREGGA